MNFLPNAWNCVPTLLPRPIAAVDIICDEITARRQIADLARPRAREAGTKRRFSLLAVALAILACGTIAQAQARKTISVGRVRAPTPRRALGFSDKALKILTNRFRAFSFP
jgi:hypothetical protein